MDPDKLQELAKQGEGPNLELQHSAPFSERLATVLAGFANAAGGRILIGIDNHKNVVGAKPERVYERLAEASALVTPPLDLNVETVNLKGKDVVVVTVPKGGQSPYSANGELFVRATGRTARITGSAIVDRITDRAQSPEQLIVEVQRLAIVIQTLNDEVGRARGWRPRMVDMVIGGIIGAVISLLLTAAIAGL